MYEHVCSALVRIANNVRRGDWVAYYSQTQKHFELSLKPDCEVGLAIPFRRIKECHREADLARIIKLEVDRVYRAPEPTFAAQPEVSSGPGEVPDIPLPI
jgi:hypothetical protein